MGAIGQLLSTLELLVPREVLLAIVVVAIIVGFPSWLHGVRSRQIRSQVRAVARSATLDASRREQDRALSMADTARKLVVLAEEALRLNQRALCERAVAELARRQSDPRDLARLRKALAPDAALPAHPLEAAQAIRRLVAEGLMEVALTRLADARTRFPDDQELRDLRIEPPVPASQDTSE
jgi:hypothetical protein